MCEWVVISQITWASHTCAVDPIKDLITEVSSNDIGEQDVP